MKKTAQLIKEHFNGKPTITSKKIIAKIHRKLIQSGFKSPFKLTIAKTVLENRFMYDDMDNVVYDENEQIVFDIEKNSKDLKHVNLKTLNRETLNNLKSVLVEKGIMSPEDNLDYYWGDMPEVEEESPEKYFDKNRLNEQMDLRARMGLDDLEEENPEEVEEMPETENEEIHKSIPAYTYDELEAKVYNPEYDVVFDLEKDVEELPFNPNDLESFKKYLVNLGIMQPDDVLEAAY